MNDRIYYYSKGTLSLNFKGAVTVTPPPSTKVLDNAMTGQPFELELVTSEPGQVVHQWMHRFMGTIGKHGLNVFWLSALGGSTSQSGIPQKSHGYTTLGKDVPKTIARELYQTIYGYEFSNHFSRKHRPIWTLLCLSHLKIPVSRKIQCWRGIKINHLSQNLLSTHLEAGACLSHFGFQTHAHRP